VKSVLKEGQRLNRYYLVRLIEKGGMGEVYLARDNNLDRLIAIKVIGTEITSYSDTGAIDEAVRLFQIEAKAITLLDHPHILPLLDYGEESIYGARYTYMVMPYRQEGSLAGWMRRNRESRPLSLPEITHFLQQAADALQYAHDHGIIHRDVKPSNFLLFGGKKYHGLPDLQLADFGVAKFMSVISTPSTAIRGTPMYMAPEMWRGEAVPASDQYALAVMVYELLAGQPPFQGSNHEQILYQHMHVQPQPLSNFNQHVPMELDIVLMRALLKNPEDRYATVSAFARAFEHALINGRNIHITLSISSAEARNGCMQVVTPTSGRRVTVTVPRGAYHGQVLRLEGQGEQSKFDGPIGALIITISIIKAVESVSLAHTDVLERTIPASGPPDNEGQRDPNQDRSKIPFLLVIFSGILVIVIFAGLLAYSSNPHSINGNPTPQQTKTTGSQHEVTTTPDVKATATYQANQTATASATSATATAVSAGATATSATATAVSNQSTATAIAQTATATAYSNIMNTGTQALTDPLQDNSQNYNWDTMKLVGGGGCAFTNGAYHSSMPQQGPFSLCFAQATNFANFTFEVKMQIIQGTVGGIVFRANSTDGTFYYFHISRNGTYGLDIYSGNLPTKTLNQGPTSAILTDPGQTNLIGVVANENKIDLYVNMQHITTVYDSTYISGQIGVVADAIDAPTEVAFSNAQVHTL
jgi:serine/threonine protein kinase